MNKEIKIINYVFKYHEKINLVSIEQYIKYPNERCKIKYVIDDKYFEKEINIKSETIERIVFDNLVISEGLLEANFDDYKIKIKVDNREIINEFLKKNNGKNNYLLSKNETFTGYINEEEISGKIIIDFENIATIVDTYYKVYIIDFSEFVGCFSLMVYDRKTPSIFLKYKDQEISNKRIYSVRDCKFFKLYNYKLIISGNSYFKVRIKVGKIFKSNPGIIPFKYNKGTLYLTMKKHLFKTSLRATGNQTLLISYKYN